MKKLMIVLAISFFAATAMSLESGEFNLVANSAAEHPCVKVNLTLDQISAIKNIVFKSRQVRAQDEANLKKAMLEVDHILASSTSTKEDAEKAQNNLQQAMAALAKAAAQLDLSINYDVLHADQREMGSLCAKYMYSFPPLVSNSIASNTK